MTDYIEFTKENLIEYKNRLNWKGNGTKGNPIVIDSLKGLNIILQFKKIKSYVVIRTIELYELYLYYCDNLIVENCTIYYFNINYCKNIEVSNSSIVNFDVQFTKNSIFHSNNFHNESELTDRTLKNNGEGGSKMSSFEYKVPLYCSLFVMIPSFVFAFILSREISLILLIGFLYFSGQTIILILVGLFLKRKQNLIKKNSNQNIFTNNRKIELDELEKKYSEQYDF